MRRRVHDLRECVKVALADLHTDIAPLSSEHYEIIAGCLRVPSIFNDTTGKLLEEKRGSSSNFSHSEVLQGKAGDAGKSTVQWKRCYFCLQINKCCPYFTCNMSLIIKAHSHHTQLSP